MHAQSWLNADQSAPGRQDHKHRGFVVALVVGLLVALGLTTSATPAQAYNTNGCHWSTTSLRMNTSAVYGQYTSGLTFAISNYNSSTGTSITKTTSSGPSWTAASNNYGATGWEAHSSWNCILKTTHSCAMSLNQYYLPGDETATNDKIVWAHEMGHCLGLSHVGGLHKVMYTSATAAYNAGIYALTSDDIAGIHAIY